jgi:hypothetical protein
VGKQSAVIDVDLYLNCLSSLPPSLHLVYTHHSTCIFHQVTFAGVTKDELRTSETKRLVLSRSFATLVGVSEERVSLYTIGGELVTATSMARKLVLVRARARKLAMGGARALAGGGGGEDDAAVEFHVRVVSVSASGSSASSASGSSGSSSAGSSTARADAEAHAAQVSLQQQLSSAMAAPSSAARLTSLVQVSKQLQVWQVF